MTEQKTIVCCVCNKTVNGNYFMANTDKNNKETEEGDIVCSEDCKQKYEKNRAFIGQPIENYSRITGYYQNVNAWNKGKIQELKERHRYNDKEF